MWLVHNHQLVSVTSLLAGNDGMIGRFIFGALLRLLVYASSLAGICWVLSVLHPAYPGIDYYIAPPAAYGVVGAWIAVAFLGAALAAFLSRSVVRWFVLSLEMPFLRADDTGVNAAATPGRFSLHLG